MSKLSKRCEKRKDEAQALADKYNALIEEQKKLESQRLQIKSEFDMKSAQYAELLSQVQEAESVQTPSEVVE
tara:strand:+ start:355 stop:570 length:216 start_codon:yes stop_codon:yes gene_type:complete